MSDEREYSYPARVARASMILQPIEQLPAALKDGRGLMIYGVHAADIPGERKPKKGDDWWAIAVWDIWRPLSGPPRWVFALNGEPITWGEPTHFSVLKPPP